MVFAWTSFNSGVGTEQSGHHEAAKYNPVNGFGGAVKRDGNLEVRAAALRKGVIFMVNYE
jgi:hypothetical protein